MNLIAAPGSLSEHLESVEDDDQAEVHERDPGNVWLPGAFEYQCVAVNTLSRKRLLEASEGVANGTPCEALGDCGQVLEPEEDYVGTSGHAHIGEQGDGGSGTDTVVGHTVLAALEEELGRLSVLGDTEKITGAGVQERITRRRSGGENYSVDDMR